MENKRNQNFDNFNGTQSLCIRFSLYSQIKSIWRGVLNMRNINIGGKNPTNINYANIGNTVKSIDTTKYYQTIFEQWLQVHQKLRKML